MIKLALSGASGRMGRTVFKSLIGSEDFTIVFGVDPFLPTDLPFPIYKSFDEATMQADVIVDFSVAASLDAILSYALKTHTKVVLATTGYNQQQIESIVEASKQIAIFKASNMSLGINLLANLSKEAMKFLGDSYDVEIVETHHNQKLDAPSGTALTLASAINEVRENALVPMFGRHETAHRREKSEIGIHAIRGGTVVGKHDVMFLGAGEMVKLSHEAENKEVLARGALRAAGFLNDKKVGLFDMNSILGDYYAVTTVNAESNISLITLPSISSDEFLSLLLNIKNEDINLDMISENFNVEGNLAVSFTLADADLPATKKLIPKSIFYTATVGTAKLNTEGAGMEHKSGVALEVLTILKNLGAKVYAITTSETKISCSIESKYLEKAELALKKYYGI
ncbi:MAG: 4-hydroxy-tetrahydrodipicolinate reductase [Clostridia bacterium]